ncbi:MAG: ArgE/DapE family deacylase [Ilumatobacteraceae bacterium]
MTDHAARVLDAVEALREPMLAELAAVVRIPSVGGTDAENDAQHYIAGRLGESGLEVDHWQLDLADLTSRADFPGMEVERREAWGVVARLPGTGDGASLMLNGHIDVVPTGDADAWVDPPYAAEMRNGLMFGRGTCDMKAGLIANVFAVQAIQNAGVQLRGDLLLASVLGEEDGGLGTYATLQRGWRADACVISEPTELDIIPANSGALTFRLRVHGEATHAARRTEGTSAIEKFWPIWQAIADLETRRQHTVDPLMARWPLAHPISIGTVHCGDWASSVPDLLVAEGRMGVALDEPVEAAREALEAAIVYACAQDPWLHDHPVEIEWWGGQFTSGRLPAKSDLVQRVQTAHRTASGNFSHEVYGAPYGSDLRLLTGLGNIPTLQYGPGDAKLAHGASESVPIEQVMTTARTLALLALDLCGIAN